MSTYRCSTAEISTHLMQVVARLANLATDSGSLRTLLWHSPSTQFDGNLAPLILDLLLQP